MSISGHRLNSWAPSHKSQEMIIFAPFLVFAACTVAFGISPPFGRPRRRATAS
jgi:hypothetical protein